MSASATQGGRNKPMRQWRVYRRCRRRRSQAGAVAATELCERYEVVEFFQA